MKSINNFVLITTIGLIGLLSCGNNTNKAENMQEAFMLSDMPAEERVSQEAPSNASDVVRFIPPPIPGLPNFIATKAASTQYDDGVHKFIRSAKMKFKVKDVPYATHVIEDIVLKNKGFIINSMINNNSPTTKTINISKDSACVIYYNNLTANLELRVPHRILDSTLRQIAPLATLIDYRTVEARDVTTQLMSDQMKQERLSKKQKRMSNAIGTRGGKLEDVMNAEESMDNALEEADNTKLAEYRMNDNIAYSSIYIDLYQDRTEHVERILRKDDNITTYQPGFGSKAIDALSSGWSVVCIIFLFLINIWPLYILAGVAVLIYFRIKKKENR